MTRFARAKGSKSSNEKTPSDATPWEVMKEQLLSAKKDNEEAKQRELVEKQRIKNYQNFLKEQKTQKRKATWCEFPETVAPKTIGVSKPEKKKKNKNKRSNDDNHKKMDGINSESNVNDVESSKKKIKNQNISEIPPNKINVDVNMEQSKPEGENQVNNADPIKKKKTKKKKNKTNNNNDGPTPENKEITEAAQKTNPQPNNQNSQQKKTKKFKDKGKPNRRKPIQDNSFRLIINGKDVDLVRYDGFPIMKKDAERLNDLKQNMMRKGIPKSEVQRTMKLERRRAEKALARLKRDVCYNCRKGGHNLSDCPELKSKIPGAEAPDGICFKCGSTEHRQFECKVQRDKEFRFASCFICKESGHIARQCPDNPKGLYPNGGSCKLCGDVTHLRKDCPTVNEQKEASSIKLPTLESTEHIEEIAQKPNPVAEVKQKKPKTITF